MFKNILSYTPFRTIEILGIVGLKFQTKKRIVWCDPGIYSHKTENSISVAENLISNSVQSTNKYTNLESHIQYIQSIGLEEAYEYIETNKLYGELIGKCFNEKKQKIFREFIKSSDYFDSIKFLIKWFGSDNPNDVNEWKYYFSQHFTDFDDKSIEDSIEKYFTQIDLETLLSNKNLTPTQLEKYFDNLTGNNTFAQKIFQYIGYDKESNSKISLVKSVDESIKLNSYLITQPTDIQVKIIKKYLMEDEYFLRLLNPRHIAKYPDINFILDLANIYNANELFQTIELSSKKIELFELVYWKIKKGLENYFSDGYCENCSRCKNSKYNWPSIISKCNDISKKRDRPYKIEKSQHWRFYITWEFDEFAYNQYLMKMFVGKKELEIVKFLVGCASKLEKYHYVPKSMIEFSLTVPENKQIIEYLIKHVHLFYYLEEIVNKYENEKNNDGIIKENLIYVKNYIEQVKIYGIDNIDKK